MGAWSEFNKKYKMTQADWAEWRRTKGQYRSTVYMSCRVCGSMFSASPLVLFLLAKGKMDNVCGSCEKLRGRKGGETHG